MTAIYLPLAAIAGLALVGLVLLQRRRVRRLERLVAAGTERLEALQLQFGRFAPAEVVERLTGTVNDPAPGKREVTVLFADLQGFTQMCDRLDPAVTVRLLNGYFQCMNAVIRRHHGRITELVGDELLALFGALEPNPWQARDAVLAALDMRAELVRYNERIAAEGLPALRFGIGIHRGEVLAGVIGHEELNKFGVVGDPVNVASRVERLTRVHGVDLLITEAVGEALDARFRLHAMPPTPVRGKAEPIVTYRVDGFDEAAPAQAG